MRSVVLVAVAVVVIAGGCASAPAPSQDPDTVVIKITDTNGDGVCELDPDPAEVFASGVGKPDQVEWDSELGWVKIKIKKKGGSGKLERDEIDMPRGQSKSGKIKATGAGKWIYSVKAKRLFGVKCEVDPEVCIKGSGGDCPP